MVAATYRTTRISPPLTNGPAAGTREGGPKAALCSRESKNRTYFF
jgi:hypothetical protein